MSLHTLFILHATAWAVLALNIGLFLFNGVLIRKTKKQNAAVGQTLDEVEALHRHLLVVIDQFTDRAEVSAADAAVQNDTATQGSPP